MSSSDSATDGKHDKDERKKAIDIERLAEKVYRLMQAELRLERARGAQPIRSRGRP